MILPRLGLALAVAVLAGSAAQAQSWPGQPPTSPEVEAALSQMRAGQSSGLRDLQRLADAGRPDAQFYLGPLYLFGAGGLAKDGVKGCAYEMKASATRADAMHLVAECYQHGYGGEKNDEKAMAAFQRASDMGLVKSKCALGNMLMASGRDEKRGAALCREAAEGGDADAQTDLGNLYLNSKILPHDSVEARRWYEKAAAQNQANAAVVLGQIYWNGDGVTKDNAAAARYWRVAFDHGREDAAKFLGDEAFVRASRPDKSWTVAGLDEARGWYEKAVEARNPDIRAEAIERAKLMQQLKDVMMRQGRGS